MDTITGCWEGALITKDGARETFEFCQPPHAESNRGPELSVSGSAAPARLLDGAARSFVALAETPDGSTGRIAQLLLDARVLGDRLVGQWLRRDADGRVIAYGELLAGRV